MATRSEDVEQYLSVGGAVVFHLEPHRKDGPRFKTATRGWETGRCIILDRPGEDGLPLSLRKDQPCVIRFMCRGEACGFDARVMDWGGSKQPYIRVSWPAYVEVMRIRKYERVEMQGPCKLVTADGTEMEGELCDISVGGCRLGCEEAHGVGSVLTLSFQLPDGTAIDDVKAVVCNASKAKGHTVHGCQFEELADDARGDIDFYVTSTLSRMRATNGAGKRILVIEKDPEEVSVLREVVEEQGYGVVTASGLVDAFYRLRMSPPSVLLLDYEQPEVSGVEVCRIIRATRGFEQLPVFVYGGEGQASEKAAMDAGATRYFASLSMTEQIVAAIIECMPADDQGSG